MKTKKKKKILLYIIILILFLTVISKYIYTIIFYPLRYFEIIESASKRYNVDPYLILSMIKVESNFNSKALSRSQAKGLMQIVDLTAEEEVININTINVNNYDIYDPYTNIEIGTKYLSKLISRYEGNIYIAICAYNAGLGNVDKWFLKPYNNYKSFDTTIELVKYSETRLYLSKVIDSYNEYKTLYK